jgi:hypothetical protein
MHIPQLLLLLRLFAFALCDTFRPQCNVTLKDFTDFPHLNFSNLFREHDEQDSKSSGHERRWSGPIPAPADDATWEAAKCKGRKFMAQMSYSDYDVGQMLPIPQLTAQSPFSFSTYSLP